MESRRGPHCDSAKLSRSLLKSFFEKGDQPTQGQFSTQIDSTANRNREVPCLRNFVSKARYGTVKNSIGNIR